MPDYTITVSTGFLSGEEVVLPLTNEQFLQLFNGANAGQLKFSLSASGLAEAEIQIDEAARAMALISKIELGDYVKVGEKDEDGNIIDVLYQYVVSPHGRRGLFRANCFHTRRCFDRNNVNVYATSSLKEFMDNWASEQNFAFAEEVSLLELPCAGIGDEEFERNRDYIASLRLSKRVGFCWTKTPYATSTSTVLVVDLHYSSYLVRVSFANFGYDVHPVLWLAPGVLIDGGQGTCKKPHEIAFKRTQ